MTCDFAHCQQPTCDIPEEASCLDSIDFDECLEDTNRCVACSEECLDASSACDNELDALTECSAALEDNAAQCLECRDVCVLDECDTFNDDGTLFGQCMSAASVDCLLCTNTKCPELESCQVWSLYFAAHCLSSLISECRLC